MDHNGLKVTKIHLPETKASREGEDVYYAEQHNLTDLKAALLNHFAINNPPPGEPLFAWWYAKGLRPLTRSKFLKRITTAAQEAGSPELKGHGIRIGGTLLYLLHGVPFDIIKTMGRWSSESFTLYLRQHAMIMAPYLQDSPILEPFTRYTMPPVH
ncbi:hypothetical protein HYDPIDRAFT_101507 [Hydnomerulius pinastri MD-312]|uniref:Tyr recombinase domain-containing protein n=1 Tax=Hydnomerulius pinastri MD-312 TaxID=994086 RepID=A0A0C9VZV2_9AGAM|nr:hypothetical protein HYDPIDRAFT_101507 [Hydnomerulius pinastri MD-312]